MRIQASPNPNHPPRGPRPEKPLDSTGCERDKRLTEWVELQSGEITAGRSLLVNLGEGHTYRIEGTKISPAARSIDSIKQFVTAGVQEVQAAIAAGPNLALVGVSQVVKPLVLNGASFEVAAQVDQWYQPGLQAASVGISLVNFVQRYHQEQQRREIGQETTTMEKVGLIANGAHIATSAIGLLGAAGAALSPSLQSFGPTAAGIALAGNVLTFGVNWLEYFDRRGDHIHPLGDVKKPK